jgi:hypothetical protein
MTSVTGAGFCEVERGAVLGWQGRPAAPATKQKNALVTAVIRAADNNVTLVFTEFSSFPSFFAVSYAGEDRETCGQVFSPLK